MAPPLRGPEPDISAAHPAHLAHLAHLAQRLTFAASPLACNTELHCLLGISMTHFYFTL